MDTNLFHKALKGVIKGETRFHIKNSRTGENFDLRYVENSSLMPDLGLNNRGVPIRGTDYKTLGFTGKRQQATVDEMLPLCAILIKKLKREKENNPGGLL